MTKAKTFIAKGILAGAALLGAAELPVIPDHTYYIRTLPASEAKPTVAYGADSIRGKKETKEVGRACFNEFYAEGKKTIRQRISCDEYWKIAKVKNYPAPKREGYIWHAYDTILYDTPSGELEDGYYYIAEKDYKSLLEPKKAKAAIAYDNAANGGNASASCSDSWSHTVAGSDRLIVLMSGVEDSTAGDRVVDSASYNGDALGSGASGDGLSTNFSLWYLANPDTGANTMSVTWCSSGSISSGGGASVSYTGVDQSSPTGGTNGTTYGNDSTPSISVDTTASNSWVVGGVTSNTNINVDNNPSQTERWDLFATFSSHNGSDNGPIASPGSTTLDWACTGVSCSTQDGTVVIMEIKVATAGASSTPADWYIEVD